MLCYAYVVLALYAKILIFIFKVKCLMAILHVIE